MGGSGNINLVNGADFITETVMGQEQARFRANTADATMDGTAAGSETFTVEAGAKMISDAANGTNHFGPNMRFNMEGRLEVSANHMEIAGYTYIEHDGLLGNNTNEVTIAQGAELVKTGTETLFLKGAEIVGEGLFYVGTSSAHTTGLYFDAGLPAAQHKVHITNGFAYGTWNGPADLHIHGSFSAVDSTFSGDGTLKVEGTSGNLDLSVSENAATNINRDLNNSGTVTWSSGNITVDDRANITNYAGANFNVQAHANMVDGGNAGSFTNAAFGNINRTGVGGTARILIDFQNNGNLVEPQGAGELEIPSLENNGNVMLEGDGLTVGNFIQKDGTVSLDAPLTVTGDLQQTGGAINVNFGTLTVSNDYLLNSGTMEILMGGIASVSGEVVVSGGVIQLDGDLNATGGVQIGSGGILEAYYGFIDGNVTNAGTIDLHAYDSGGPWSVLYISGDYTQTSTGTLILDIESWENDLLDIAGTATFAGTLEVLDYSEIIPPAWLYLINYGSRSGGSEFDTVLLPTVSEGTWDYEYDDTAGAFVLTLEEEI